MDDDQLIGKRDARTEERARDEARRDVVRKWLESRRLQALKQQREWDEERLKMRSIQRAIDQNYPDYLKRQFREMKSAPRIDESEFRQGPSLPHAPGLPGLRPPSQRIVPQDFRPRPESIRFPFEDEEAGA